MTQTSEAEWLFTLAKEEMDYHKQYDKALELLKQALALKPSNCGTILYLMNVCEQEIAKNHTMSKNLLDRNDIKQTNERDHSDTQGTNDKINDRHGHYSFSSKSQYMTSCNYSEGRHTTERSTEEVKDRMKGCNKTIYNPTGTLNYEEEAPIREKRQNDKEIGTENREAAIDKDFEEKFYSKILCMSMSLRAYVMTFGIKAFASKPNYRPDIDFAKIENNINVLIENSQESFFKGNRVAADLLLQQAEKLYEEVAIILPRESMPKHDQLKPGNDINHKNIDSNNINLINNQAETVANSGTNSTSYKSTTVYKDFVTGDDIAVMDSLAKAEAYLTKKNFKKAENFVCKSERMCKTINDTELSEKVKAVRQKFERAAKEAAEEEAARDSAECENTRQEEVIHDSKTTNSQPINVAKIYDINERIGTASKSSTVGDSTLVINNGVPVFQPTDDKQKDSKQYANIAHFFLAKGDVKRAETVLVKAKELNDGDYLQPLFDQLENLKAGGRFENFRTSFRITKAYDINSQQETQSTYYPDKQSSNYTTKSTKSDQNYSYIQSKHERIVLRDVKSDQIFNNLKSRAIEECNRQDFHQAKLFLIKAYELKPDDVKLVKMLQKVDDQLVLDSRRLDSKRASTSSNSYLDNLLDKASEAFEKEDFDECEYLLNEAYHIHPSKEILLYINQVQSHRNKQKNGNSVQHFNQSPTNTEDEGRFYGTRQEAVKCVEKAEELFNNGELDRAENLFLKAHRMLKQTTDTELTEHVQNMLKRVNIEKEKKFMGLANNENKNEEKERKEALCSKTESEIKAQDLLNKALDAKLRGVYYVAESWLQKANYWCSNEQIVKLLKEVQETIKDKIANMESQTKKKLEYSKRKEMENEAKKYLSLSEENFNKASYSDAKELVFIADSLCQTKNAKELLEIIWHREYYIATKQSKKINKNKRDDLNSYKAKNYIDMANRAQDIGDLLLMEYYLQQSCECKSSVEAQEKLKQIRDDLNSFGENASTSSNEGFTGTISGFLNRAWNFVTNGRKF